MAKNDSEGGCGRARSGQRRPELVELPLDVVVQFLGPLRGCRCDNMEGKQSENTDTDNRRASVNA